MSESLLQVVRSLDRDQIQQLIPRSDLEAIAEGRDSEVSRACLQAIRGLQTSLGAGEFIDVGTSVAGALAGASYGAAAGPIGAAVGGLVGGAAGAFGGEIIEDLLAGREIQAGLERGGAAREAVNSALWDTAFLGAGKIVRGIGRALDIDAGRLLGIVRAQDKAPDVTKIADDFDEESVAGLQQINNYLISKGGGLTGFQTGQETAIGRFIEGIANIGTLSSGMLAKRNETNAKILDDFSKKYIDDMAVSLEDMGQVVSDVSEAGVRATRSAYERTLEGIAADAGNKTVSTSNIAKAIKAISADTQTMIESTMSKQAAKVLRDRANVLTQTSPIVDTSGQAFTRAKTSDVGSLIEYQKKLTRITNDARPSPTNPGSDSVYRELTTAEKKVKDAIQQTLNDIEPSIGQRYTEANRAYGEALNTLRPSLISNKFANAANKEAYTQLGKVVLGKRAEDIRTLMGSIDTAFAQIGRPKGAVDTQELVRSAEEAKKLIRRSYLSEIMKGEGNVLKNETLGKLANRFKSKTENQVAKEIFGEEFGQFKFMIGALEKITQSASPEFMALSIRGRELSQLSNLGQGAIGVGLASTGGFLGALAIFGVPAVLARISLSKTASQRMLRLANDLGKNPDRPPEIIAAQVAKVLDALPEDDRNFISGLGL